MDNVQADFPVKPPTFKLGEIFSRRDKLALFGLYEHHGVVVTGARLALLALDISRMLPGAKESAIIDSLRYLLGSMPTSGELYTVAWRMAGNLPRLRAGTPVPPWTGQTSQEWVPVQIMNCRPTTSASGREGAMFCFRALAGTLCPAVFEKFWSHAYCGIISRRLGYTAPWHTYPYADISELVSLRLLVMLDPRLSANGRPGFEYISTPTSLVKWNRENVIQYRFRRHGKQPWPCPQGFTHPCFSCPIGYLGPQGCRAATHPYTQEVSHGTESVSNSPSGCHA